MLQVDLDALRALGAALTVTADSVGWLDPVAPIVAAADARRQRFSAR